MTLRGGVLIEGAPSFPFWRKRDSPYFAKKGSQAIGKPDNLVNYVNLPRCNRRWITNGYNEICTTMHFCHVTEYVPFQERMQGSQDGGS